MGFQGDGPVVFYPSTRARAPGEMRCALAARVERKRSQRVRVRVRARVVCCSESGECFLLEQQSSVGCELFAATHDEPNEMPGHSVARIPDCPQLKKYRLIREVAPTPSG